MNDATIVLRDIAGDASQQASNKLRPSQEQLDQVDQPAEENAWHEMPDTEKYKSRAKNTMKKTKGTVSTTSTT